jgi:hypothetical protein
MADLVSPGVQVTVIDESNYAPAAVGSVAYILLATAENKYNPSGTAYAAGTLASNATKIYTITSQRELVQTFGNPIFKTTASGAPINGDEQNEYGLLAAYSLLAVSNQVYIQRANVDLADLGGTTTRPTDPPTNGTYWLDTVDSTWGVYEWNATTQSFTNKSVLVINSSDDIVGLAPNANIGNIGSYAVTTVTAPYRIWQKTWDNKWNFIGSSNWVTNVPTVISTKTSTIDIGTNQTIYINGTAVSITTSMTTATDIASAINTATPTDIRANVLSTGNFALFTTGATDATRWANVWGATTAANSVIADIGLTPGIFRGPTANVGPYTSVPTYVGQTSLTANTGRPSGSIWHKTSIQDSGLTTVVKRYNSTTEAFVSQTVNDYANVFTATYGLDPTNGGQNISTGTVFTQYDTFANTTTGMQLWYRSGVNSTVGTGTSSPTFTNQTGNTFVITTRPVLTSAATQSYTITVSANTASGIINPVLAAGIPYINAGLNASGQLFFEHTAGGDIVISKGSNIANAGISTSGTNIHADPTGTANVFVISNWTPIEDTDYYVDSSAPTVSPANGTRWYYNTPSRVDVLINNGSAWVGYKTLTNDVRGYNLSLTDPNGVIISSVEPTEQSDGTVLVYGDLWLDTSDLENYPKMYRYQSVNATDTWIQINNTDNTSINGILFADARWATDGDTDPITDDIPTIVSLLESDYVDLDAPDPDLYPRGMLLFNTRASGYNVKEYRSNYFTTAAYPGESLPTVVSSWVSVSGYEASGVVPNFGRKAPRGVVVAALKSAMDSSEAIREDNNFFNIIACPGYPELMPNMVALNEEKDNTAFVVGDTPFRLAATGTDIQAWATNSNGATATGEEGLNTTSPYVGVYYPSGQTTDPFTGVPVVVPPSHVVLRALIKNDTVGYPWLAPAGTRRGLIDNVSAIGYIDGQSGRFISVGINQGLRDIMYENKINPFTVLPGTGLLIYGQKTLSATPSALDRINVARLTNYLRTQLNIAVRPFLFEPNDPITRNAVIAIVSSILNDLIAKRGVTDYLVVCDTTNNTPTRIAQNQLWVDVAIQPTKDVEFIYIPIRLKNPGEIQSGNLASAAAVGTGA